MSTLRSTEATGVKNPFRQQLRGAEQAEETAQNSSAPAALELEGFHLLRIIPGEPDHRCHDCIRELDDSLKCGICGAEYAEVSS